MKRVFLYVRVSTEEQAIHGLSIEAQAAALEEWAQANRHKVVGVYTDAGISIRLAAHATGIVYILIGHSRKEKWKEYYHESIYQLVRRI